MRRETFPSLSTVEVARLAALHEFGILDTPVEKEFEEVTRLAAAALGVASSAISLIDTDRQWFKARHGIQFSETPRDISFCTHAVAAREPLIVPDATLDSRFSSNPLVTAENGIRFYAGVPLIVAAGHCLGTLCVFDPLPRAGLTPGQAAVMEDLAKLATDLIESRRFRRMGEIAGKVVDATSDAIIAVDQEKTIVYWNPAAESLFSRSAREALGSNVELIVPARHRSAHRKLFDRAAAHSPASLIGVPVALTGIKADGTEFPIELSLAQLGDVGSDGGFAAIVRDITSRRSLERDRKHAQTFLDTVISNLPAMLFVKDAETRKYVLLNQTGERLIGRRSSDIVGATDRELFSSDGTAYEERDSEVIASQEPQTFESEFQRTDGSSVNLRTTRVLIDGPDRRDQFILGVTEDVTQTREIERKLLHLARYDSLTGLLNRSSLTELLLDLVKRGVPFAMLSIDLDRFKAINDQFGHLAGDETLTQVGERLRSLALPTDWLARIGGDEFIAVLTGDGLRERSGKVANDITAAMTRPFTTRHGVAHAGASVGLVLFPEDARSLEQLRENADLALYRAKEEGRGKACAFDASMDATARDRRKLETDLRLAVQRNLIGLFYQPVVSAKTGRVTSLEALARWNHAGRGNVKPDVFITLAEECGLINELGEQLLRQACTDALSWPEEIRVAVNLSPLQFQSENLLATISNVLAATGLAPDRLQLEVTEGLVIRDVERTFSLLERLRSLGIQILIDDFGVGYSSLSYFQRFPFDKVKIDKSFVDEIETSQAAKAIVQAVVGLGAQLNMGVVAEGVETQNQMNLLRVIGCTHLQGYLFSRPLSASAVEKLFGLDLRSAVIQRQAA